MCQTELNQYLEENSCNYKDSVDNAYAMFLDNAADIYREEVPFWDNYFNAAKESYKTIQMGGCGSSAPMSFSLFLHDIQYQHLVSFSENGEKHAIVSDNLIRQEYEHFLRHGYNIHSDEDDNYSEKEKQTALKNEQTKWNSWMKIRDKISRQLSGPEKRAYDNQTNELKRLKLIQLKNQYEEYSISSEEFFKNAILNSNCTDKQLKEWTRCDEKWSEYTSR